MFPCHGAPSQVDFITVHRVPGFMDSDEAPVLERLIDAYRERDSDAMRECCDSAVFRSMDNEVCCPHLLTNYSF